MKITKMVVGLKRDVRLAQYNVSQCSVELTIDVDTEASEEVQQELYKELYDDVVFAVSSMAKEEIKNFNEAKQNKLKKEQK